MDDSSKNVKVSVLVPAYNMAPYLAQCLDSIVAQKTNFKYQILVAEDCSTDNTRDVAQVYEKRYPDLIKVFYNATNLGASLNLCKLIEKVQSELFVQVDGDDYITDNYKLQIQADLMDKHPDCAVCFHNYATVDSNGNNSKNNISSFNGDCVLPNDFLRYHELGPGNIVMIRRSALPGVFPGWMYKCGFQVDYLVHCMAATEGKIYYINKVMSAYRKHPLSVTTVTKKEYFLEMMVFNPRNLSAFYRAKGLKEDAAFFSSLVPGRHMVLAYFYLSQGRILRFIYYFIKGFVKAPILDLKVHKDMVYKASPELAQKLRNYLP